MAILSFIKKGIIPISILIVMAGPAAGMDEDGCLTCHRFPGMVRYEKDLVLKVLHIDETRYMASKHGRFKCTSCHTAISEVPHTGQSKVACAIKCHQGRESKTLPRNYSLKGFHQKEQSFITRLDEKTSCRACHRLYPHQHNNLVRGFLNMHVGFMGCEVCHLKKQSYDGIRFRWQDSENAFFSGAPFGTLFNPQLSQTSPSGHFISRIAAFAISNGHRQSMANSQDRADAMAYQRLRNTLTNKEQAERLKFFHRDTAKKEISVACEKCHSGDSILDYAQLGFEEKKARQLVNLNLKGLVTKYETFYLPKLFDDVMLENRK